MFRVHSRETGRRLGINKINKKDPEGYEVRDYLRCLIQQITMITIPSKRIAPPSKLNTGLEITMFIPSTS